VNHYYDDGDTYAIVDSISAIASKYSLFSHQILFMGVQTLVATPFNLATGPRSRSKGPSAGLGQVVSETPARTHEAFQF
jgi:hypothetical protein